MPMFPENSMSLKGREGTFPEIHCTMSRPISKNAMGKTQQMSNKSFVKHSLKYAASTLDFYVYRKE